MALFALAIFMSFTSATLTVSDISDLSHISGSFNVDISSTENETVTLTIEDIEQGSNKIVFSGYPASFELNDTLNNRTLQFTVTYTIDPDFDFEFGETYPTDLVFNGTNSSTLSKTVSFEPTNFCEFGEVGKLEITAIDIHNSGGGDDQDWEYLDDIEFEITVENTDGDDSISSVEARIVILDEDGTDVTKKFVDDSDDRVISFGRIKEDTEETKSFNIRVDPEIDQGKYRVYVKTYKDNHEDEHCSSESDDFSEDGFHEIEVLVGDEEVGIDNIQVEESFSCGSSGTVSFDFYNFDLSEKEEDMEVGLYHDELEIDLRSEKFDLRSGKEKRLSFDFSIPKDVEEGEYRLRVRYYFDYDEDDDSYGESEEYNREILIQVEGNCKIVLPTVTAELVSSEAIEGEEMIVKVFLRNDHGKSVTFFLSAEGFGSWANLKQVNPETFTLDTGESKEVFLTFDLRSGSEGDQQFNLIVSSGGDIVMVKPILVSVQEGSFWNSDLFEGWDWTIIGIVVLNLILIIAIIVVARKVLRRR